METPIKTNGDPSIRSLATGLGTLGRYGDSYMVHAAEGETVVPREILEANPELRANLFSQMRMMGVDDPNRYVVGNSLNSINPVTGQPEFFFKKIWRAIKKVAKVVAPIVIPIIGNMIAPGIGGILASGLYSKATGGSWGDALTSAGTAWLGGSLAQGLGGMGEGGQGFMSGLKTGFTDPLVAGANLFSKGAANPLSQGILGAAGYTGIAPTYDRTAGRLPASTAGEVVAPELMTPEQAPGMTPQDLETLNNALIENAPAVARGDYNPSGLSAADLASNTMEEIENAPAVAAGDYIAPTIGDRVVNLATENPMATAAIAATGVTGVGALINSKSDEDILPPEGSEKFAAYDDWNELKDKDSPEAQTLYHQWNQTPGDLGYTREAWASM